MKVMTVIGTRPEAIKMAPVLRLLSSDSTLDSVCVNTAQHREMIDQVFDIFSVAPEYDLNVMKPNQSLDALTSEIITKTSSIMKREKPAIVLVHGDTTTTFSAAYAAFINQIPVAHVEAGLRTYDMAAPFPEEMNRQLVSRLARYHFACTEENKMNLQKENIDPEHILVTGNTVIDALLETIKKEFVPPSSLSSVFGNEGRMLLVTTHRRENWETLKNIYAALNRVIEEHSDVCLVFPVHKNPLVRSQVERFLAANERVHMLEPLDYMSFCHLMKKAHIILTDSGGIQEEACALGKPCLVTRERTERPEGLKTAGIKLVGTDTGRICEELRRLLTDPSHYARMSNADNPFGDGRAAERIVQFIKRKLLA
ncbi:non-hydrolyzing UDP-N-acetylglucosamine 2-epimerase [Laceyella putida]|uniref:UDP-N-acetylglucosamine 2-epimerase (non-hydrolyzing) n=1 Tax=Laceyella putida TaxID=110101 RepID=A0ABW2RL42_9BACL